MMGERDFEFYFPYQAEALLNKIGHLMKIEMVKKLEITAVLTGPFYKVTATVDLEDDEGGKATKVIGGE